MQGSERLHDNSGGMEKRRHQFAEAETPVVDSANKQPNTGPWPCRPYGLCVGASAGASAHPYLRHAAVVRSV